MANKYKISFDAELNINQMRGALNQFQQELNNLKFPASMTKGVTDTFSKLSDEIKNFEELRNKGVKSPADFSKLEASGEKIISLYEKLKKTAGDLSKVSGKDLEKLFPQSAVDTIEKARKALVAYEGEVKKAATKVDDLNKKIQAQQNLIAQAQAKRTTAESAMPEAQTNLDQASKAVQDKTGISDTSAALQKLIEDYNKASEAAKKYEEAVARGESISPAQKGVITKKNNLEALIKAYTDAANKVKVLQDAINNAEGDINKGTDEIGKLNEALKKAQAEQDVSKSNALKGLLDSMNELNGIDMSKYEQSFDGAKKALEDFIDVNGVAAKGQVENFLQALESSGINVDDLKKKLAELGQQVADTDARMKEVSALKSRIQYFFGLQNSINLVKRAIRSAFDTIKELDKVMTETAVVTDFSVSDMWEQLPEYTKRANELGVTTKAAYEAATLYYQQGLKTNEVNALSVETLKMARIAGLDAAEATDRMTNALRGFNMALTTANAQRVDDVYSELAANTASNVDEISTAMTKVASLAHNANMEFETTAAFLAQIIETTRESAETAGTALKTVVARFSEVKKLVNEGQLTGTDEEGGIIDVNRVGTALRTAGIDLNKYFLGEVGLDDIFMELASKWDTLTSVQQRYIATQAAGSRQQSRFIALMQDYARTQELVGKAYNSSGASEKQFAKTQESLESKLNRLKNAWNEFLMGLTNSVVVKSFVDLLTDLLNTINKLTDAFGESGSSIAKWGVVLAGLVAGGSLFKNGGLIEKILGNTFLSNFLGFNKQAGTKKTSLGGLTQLSSTLMSTYDSTGIIDLSASFKKLITAIKAAGASLKVFIATAAPLIGIAAAIAGFAALTAYNEKQYARQNDPTIILKEQADQAKEFADKTQDLSSELDDVAQKWKNVQEQQSSNLANINNADSIKQYKDSVQAQNEYIRSLIESDAAYSKYVQSVEGLNGEIVLTLDEAALAAAAKDAADMAVKAAVGATFAQQNVYAASNAVLEAQKRQLESQYSVRDGKYYKTVGTTNDFAITPYGTYALNGINGQLNEIEISPDSYDAILAEMQSIESSIQENNNQIAEIAAQGYYQLGEHQGLSGDVLNLTSQALGLTFSTESYNDAIQQIISATTASFGDISDKELRDRYLASYRSIYGREAEVGISNDDLQRAVATATYQTQQSLQVQDLGNFIQSSELAKSLVQAFNGEVELDVKSLAHANELAKILKLDEKDFADRLAKQQNILIQRKRNAASDYYTSMMQAGITPSNDIISKINGLSLDDLNRLNDIATSLQDTLSPDSFQNLLNTIPNLESDELLKLNLFSKSFNLDQPLAAFQQLQTAIKRVGDDSPLKNILIDIREVNSDLFSASSLLQSFTLTDEYDELTKSLQKLISKNGRLTAENINELAESSENLATLLEQDEINAESLARTLTLLQNGEISFENLTEKTLIFLKEIVNVDDKVKDLQSRLANFNKGLDYGEGSDFFTNLAEDLTELIDSYEFGNDRLIKLYEEFAGEGSYQALIDKYWNDDPEAFAKIIQKRVDTMRTAIENNSYEFMNTFAGNEDLGISRINNSQYDFNWDTQGRTYDEMIKAVQAAWSSANGYEIGQDYAESILQGYMAQSPKFKAEIEQNNYTQALKDFAANAQETGYVTTQELEVLAAAAHKKVEEIRADLIAAGLTLPIEISLQKDGKALAGNELFAEWDKIKEQFEMPMLEDGVIDYQKALAGLQEYGMSAAQAIEILNKEVADSGEELKLGEQIIEGFDEAGQAIQTTLAEPTAQALESSVNEALEAQNFKPKADALAKSIGTEVANALKTALAEPGEDGTILASTVGNNMYGALTSAWSRFIAFAESNQPTVTIGSGGHAAGGIVKSRASGSNREISSGFALTGEEGPEIIWNKEAGYAYITGQNGAEFQNLQPGDRVFNTSETSRIFRNSNIKNGIFGSYASGGYNPKKVSKATSSGGGSSGSKDKDDKDSTWRNDLDWLYNLMEKITELERDQNKLQEKYDDLLTDQTKTGKDLYNLLVKQLGNLYTQLNHQTFALQKREQEMREFMDKTNDQDKYLWYDWSNRQIKIDWDAIDKIKDEELYKHVKELIDEAEEIQGKMDDAEDAVTDIQNQIQELEDIWRDTFTDFEGRVLDAVIQSYQQVIDKYSELNDTLNNSNSQILDSLQKQISLERQIRDNTKTEQEITDEEARLAYLRRDTSGGNDLAALQLQKTLEEQREDYEDTLVDQAINRLQEDNDAAAQQRQQQIDIMQAQLDYQSENGEFNQYVRDLLTSAMGADGELLTNSDLVSLLKEQENWDAMSEVNKQVWEEELNNTFKEVVAFLLKQNAEENGTFYTALTAAVKQVSTAIGSYSQAMTKLGSEVTKAATGGGSSSSGSKGRNGGKSGNGSGDNTVDYNRGKTITEQNVVILDPSKLKKDGFSSSELLFKRYATGGLANSTGLAWLDGTTSEPEYVLNARQTDAFLKLADILPSMMNDSLSTTQNTFGATYVNLSVNLESVSPDYDVDRMVSLVKDKLYDAGSYRNINSLSFLR